MPPKASKRKAANGYKLPDPLPQGLVVHGNHKKSFRLGKSIGTGGFGEIYLTSEDTTRAVGEDASLAMKIEPHENGPLFVEMNFYIRAAQPSSVEEFQKAKKLKSFGMPCLRGNGSHIYKDEKYRFLVMDRFGKDLQKLFQTGKKRFSDQVTYNLAIKIIDVLEYIHSKGYAHNDIKAQNLLLGYGRTKENDVYLVDFGLVSKYQRDGVHNEYKPDARKAHDGTIEYTSRDAHIGAHSRRSDFEILGYNLVHWMSGDLPWLDVLTDPTAVQAKKNEYLKNVRNFLARCFNSQDYPDVLETFLNYVVKLEFDTTPDYDKCRKMFSDALTSANYPLDGKIDFASPKKAKKRGRKSKNTAFDPMQEKTESRKSKRIELLASDSANVSASTSANASTASGSKENSNTNSPGQTPVQTPAPEDESDKPVYLQSWETIAGRDPESLLRDKSRSSESDDMNKLALENRALEERRNLESLKNPTSEMRERLEILEKREKERENLTSWSQQLEHLNRKKSLNRSTSQQQENWDNIIPNWMTPQMQRIMERRQNRVSEEYDIPITPETSESEEADENSENSSDDSSDNEDSNNIDNENNDDQQENIISDENSRENDYFDPEEEEDYSVSKISGADDEGLEEETSTMTTYSSKINLFNTNSSSNNDSNQQQSSELNETLSSLSKERQDSFDYDPFEFSEDDEAEVVGRSYRSVLKFVNTATYSRAEKANYSEEDYNPSPAPPKQRRSISIQNDVPPILEADDAIDGSIGFGLGHQGLQNNTTNRWSSIPEESFIETSNPSEDHVLIPDEIEDKKNKGGNQQHRGGRKKKVELASEDTSSNGLQQQQEEKEMGQIDIEKTIEIPADVTSQNKDTKRKNRRKSSNSNATSENNGMEYQIHDNEEIPLQFFSNANKNKRNNRKKSNSSEVSSKSSNTNSEKIPTEEVNPDVVNIAENTKIKRRRLSTRKMSLDLRIDEHFNSSVDVCNTTLESKNEYKQTADYDSTTVNKQLINTVDGKRTKRRKSSAKTREIEHHSPSSDSQQQQQNPIPNDIVPNDFIVEPALLEQNNEELLVQPKKVVKSRKGWRKSMDPLNSTSTNWSVVSPEKWRTSTHPLTSTSTNWSVVSPDKIPHQSAADLPESSEHNNPNEINTKKIISKKRSKKKKITVDHVVPEASNDSNGDVFEELPPPPAKKKRGRKKKKDAGVIVEATNKNISDLVNFNETFDMVGLPVSNDSSILETAPSPKKKRGRKKKEAGILDVVENNGKVKLDDLNVLKSEKINENLDVVHNDNVLETPSPKKKRGRKKKIDLEQVPEKLELNNEVFTTENKKTKKRGRKKKVEAVPNEAADDENLLATGSNLNSVEDLAAEGQQQFEQQNKLAVEKKQTKKRVRKKKSVEAVVTEAADIITEEFESPKVEEVSFEANHPGEGQKKAKKRGRKKKKEVPIVVETDDKTVAIDAVDHQEEGLEGGLQAQVISNSTATENNFDSPSLENVVEKPPPPQKRARKKKSFWVYEEDPIGQYVVLPKPPQNDSLIAFQNEVKSAGNQFISSEDENMIVKIKENTTKKSKSVPIQQPLATDDLKQPEITPIENKKASGKSKKAKKRKHSLIEEQQESPDVPELEDPSPSPKKGRTGSASAGRKSMTSDVASSAAAPKKTEKKVKMRKKNKKTPRRKSIQPEALPPKTFNQDEVVVDDDENQFHEKFHETEVIVTHPRKNNPTASLRTNMRSTDASKRTTRTQESKRNWEHVLNTNPETMFRKQK